MSAVSLNVCHLVPCSVTKCVSSRSMLLATAPTTMADGEQDTIFLVESELVQQVSSFALDIGKSGWQS